MSTTINELKAQIAELRAEIENFERDPDDYTEQYDEFLDEFWPVCIGSLEYAASMVLREVDPIAYRCGLLDYVDSLDKDDDPRFRELTERLEELEGELEDAQEEEDEE